jgi:hypothetical protein
MRKYLLIIGVAVALMCAMACAGATELQENQGATQHPGVANAGSDNTTTAPSGNGIAGVNAVGLSPQPLLETDPGPGEGPVSGSARAAASVEEGRLLSQWTRCIGGTHKDSVNSLQNTMDGGYIVAGGTNSSDGDMAGPAGYHGGQDSFVAKLDSAGTVQWVTCVGGTVDEEGYAVRQTADGGYILAGGTNSPDGDMAGAAGYHGGKDSFVARLNATGVVQWVRCIGGTLDDYGYSVQQTADGGYILAGYTNSTDGDLASAGKHGGTDSFTAGLDSAGTVQWVRCIGGTGDDEGYSVQQTADGGYVLAGYTYSSDGDMAGTAGYHGNADSFAAKLNSTGMVQWVRCVGGTLDEYGYSVQQTADGGYVLAGYTYSSDGDMASSGYHGNADSFAAKLNSAGTVQWVRCVGGTGFDTSRSVQQTLDGGYVLGGYTLSVDGDISGAGFWGGGDACVAKLNSAGTKQWVRCVGGMAYDSGSSVLETMDGGYVLAGETTSSTGDMASPGGYHGAGDGFVARLSVPKDQIGVFLNGQWYMDASGNGIWQGIPTDRYTSFGGAGDIPVTGDWNRDYLYEIGILRNGQWFMEISGNYLWDGTTLDRLCSFGIPGDIPVIGDWNDDTIREIGVYRDGVWYVDANPDFLWKGTGSGKDAMYNFGAAGFVPVVGDWNHDGLAEIGVYAGAGTWYVDANRNHLWDGTGTGKDAILNFGFSGAAPVTGDWNGDGMPEIGIYSAGTWYLDANGNNKWDGTGLNRDIIFTFGAAGFTPVVGQWS